MPIGAELAADGGVHFRVWAPRRQTVDVLLYDSDVSSAYDATTPCEIIALVRSGDYFAGRVASARAGSLYRFRLDGGASFADPASRFQPNGPHGPSQVIDPTSFAWSDNDWAGPRRDAPVLYEMHIGTFTAEGSWRAAIERLPGLAELGISIVEVMPVHEFAGRFGWGYDGVNHFAPFHWYGSPDDMRAFVDRAHAIGLGVILDVVYNHFGPDGNVALEFSDAYCTDAHQTDWGRAINFDEPGSAGTREFFVSNAAYWIDEYHLDGLRLDATQNIYDGSDEHVLAVISERARAAAGRRPVYLVAENESQDVGMVRSPSAGGQGLDAVWNDDWHHSAMVALSGRDEAYYTDYSGTGREFVAAARFGYLYQGQWYSWQQKPRGVPSLDVPPHAFVHFLENHDQVANSVRGDRLAAVGSARRVRALTALLLLGPQTPMLFQGQEFGSSRPWNFFADHNERLMTLVRDGRAAFLRQFPSIAAAAKTLPDPGDVSTFARCKLDHDEAAQHPDTVALHRDLIGLRRDDLTLRTAAERGVDGASLGENAFVLRYFGDDADDRLLLVNLGHPLHLRIMAEPLLAPPSAGRWSLHWTSEDPRYGGGGVQDLSSLMSDWHIPGDCAVLFRPARTSPT
ncbi:MAG TPA: malto-oligosyltrehalose trehalohydrolase [Gemmatimonadaceae bacterium]|nr:malto-oligosyltrehalose trehalohydrolase [Gemmatimonadaceae bacterium]